VVAIEALVRWEHHDLGLLMPASFIDVAEHTNLIKPLTSGSSTARSHGQHSGGGRASISP